MNELKTFDPLVNNEMRLVADNPRDMQKAQEQLKQWSLAKLNQLKGEHGLSLENLAEAKAAGLRVTNFQRAANVIARRIDYYEKIRQALKLGYYIVPNFPVDVFAIRTKAKKPKRGETTAYWNRHLQEAQKLKAGEGRYVDSLPKQMQEDRPVIRDGKESEKTFYFADEFQDVQFPIALVRTEVVRSTTDALGHKVFDQVGVIPERRVMADPMIIGQILDPRGSGKMVSFLVAWWLDTETL